MNGGTIFINGPKASAVVWDAQDIEPVISALCARCGDLAEDYTATDVSGLTLIGWTPRKEEPA